MQKRNKHKCIWYFIHMKKPKRHNPNNRQVIRDKDGVWNIDHPFWKALMKTNFKTAMIYVVGKRHLICDDLYTTCLCQTELTEEEKIKIAEWLLLQNSTIDPFGKHHEVFLHTAAYDPSDVFYKWMLQKKGEWPSISDSAYNHLFESWCYSDVCERAKEFHTHYGFPNDLSVCYTRAQIMQCQEMIAWLDTFPEMKPIRISYYYVLSMRDCNSILRKFITT